MQFHPIQSQILTKFISQAQLRFSEIKIPNIENDLFNYHLQHLVKQGFLIKGDGNYSLTQKGKAELLMMDSTGKVYQGLRVSVLLYVLDLKSRSKQILVQKRTRQPYQNEVSPGLAGKIMPGELIVDAAKRKLKEETRLTGEFKFVGVYRKIRKTADGTFLDDGLFHVCVCTNSSGNIISSNKFGENYWTSFDEATKLTTSSNQQDSYASKILKKITEGDFSQFYFEEVVELT
jgi:8-oxo-dGTP pyrophosphatase MutT (NUDIX family)